jgi:AmmeMemoRadiSam system protein B/AmmeMemoRadiSam system protein A
MKKLIPVTMLAVIGVTGSCGGEQIHQATGAGRWYPADKEVLATQVDAFLAEKPERVPEGAPVGIIAPHAGYRFSGRCAGAAFSFVKGRSYDRVIVLGISHRVPFEGASILKVDAYATPLGTIAVDRETCDRLLRHKLFSTIPAAHAYEHSLENELPFLQRALKGRFKLVPILIGSVDEQGARSIAEQLRPLFDDSILIVASSDFTHHGRDYNYVRFRTDLKKNLKKLAMEAAGPIEALDVDGFRKHCEETGDTICGRNAIGVLLCALQPGTKGTAVRYYTSGDLLGDYDSSVSYLSFVFTRGVGMISEEGQTVLLGIARRTIEAGVRSEKLPPITEESPELQLHQGAFVTITKDGALRGCIGCFTADEPLCRVVQRMAHASAFEDVRFVDRRLRPGELADMQVEISVLSPMQRVKTPLEEVKLGVHGIYIRRGMRSGTFLPQVATEHNMTVEEFLSTCCAHKAGLPADAWKDPDTEVYVYSAQVFGEE